MKTKSVCHSHCSDSARFPAAAWIAVAVMACLLQSGMAATFTFDRDYSYSTPRTAWLASSSDLINQGQSSVSSTSFSGSAYGSGAVTNLNDGSNHGFYGNFATGFAADLGTCVWTVDLNGAYNVSSIVVYSGGDYNYASQDFQLEYRVAGSSEYTTNFSTLDPGGNNTPGSSIAIRLTITPQGAELQNIDSLRFTFPNGYPNYPLYEEIDVFGVTNGSPGGPTISIESTPSQQSLPGALPIGIPGIAYFATNTASGGQAPYAFAVTSGGLPAGLSLVTNGVITGTPVGVFGTNVTITATDANGYTGSTNLSVSIGLTFDRDYSYNAAPIWIAATNDLINQGQASLLSTSSNTPPGAALSPGSYANLNNGSNGGFDGNASSGFMADLGTCVWTASLNGAYNISNIVAYSGGDYNVGTQDFQLEYRVSGSPNYTTLFSSLDQGGNNVTGGSSIAIRLTIDTGGLDLQNIDSLRFTFPNGYPVYPKYDEIDVFGTQVNAQPPTLSVVLTNSLAVVYWSASTDPGYVLQTNSNLATPTWGNAGAPFVDAGYFVVTNSIQGNALFFRLKK